MTDKEDLQQTGEQNHFYVELLRYRVEGLRLRYERGDGAALLTAVKNCLAFDDLKTPGWVAQAFSEGINRYTCFKAKTVDEAFGIKRPKNFRLHTARRDFERRLPVYKRCGELIEAGQGVSNALFDKVAKEQGLNRRQVSEYYYKMKKLAASLHGN